MSNNAISDFAKILAVAWGKYTHYFGHPPHGTEKQLAALLELSGDEARNLIVGIGAKDDQIAALSVVVKDLKKDLNRITRKNKRGYSYDRDEVFNIATNALSRQRRRLSDV